MVILKSKDIVLRPAKLSDAKAIYELQQDKDTKKNFMSVPKSVLEVKKDIQEQGKDKKKFGIWFVIEFKGELVGEITVHQEDPRNKTKAKISYWVAKSFRGKGIATIAVKLITNYAFKKWKLVRIRGNVRTFNKASSRVLEKAGYKYEGTLRKNNFKDGKYLDDMVWARVR